MRVQIFTLVAFLAVCNALIFDAHGSQMRHQKEETVAENARLMKSNEALVRMLKDVSSESEEAVAKKMKCDNDDNCPDLFICKQSRWGNFCVMLTDQAVDFANAIIGSSKLHYDVYVVCLASFIAGLAHRGGHGLTLVFMSIFFLFKSLDLATLTYVQAQFVDATMCSALLLVATLPCREHRDLTMMSSLILIGIVSSFLGAVALESLAVDATCTRILGAISLASILIMCGSRKKKNKIVRLMSFSGWVETTIICICFFAGGLCEGTFGVGGPAVIILILIMGYGKESNKYTIPFYFTTNFTKSVTMVFYHVRFELPVQRTLIVLPVISVLFGNLLSECFLNRFINEQAFRTMLMYFLFMLALSCLSYQSKYSTLISYLNCGVLVITALHTFDIVMQSRKTVTIITSHETVSKESHTDV